MPKDKNKVSIPDEGVVTLADERFFPSLVIMWQSIQLTYPVPVVCFDAGLTSDQRAWALENMPGCDIRPIPENPSIDRIREKLSGRSLNKTEEWLLWVCPFLIGASPFQRTFWLDVDLVVLGGLGELFHRLDAGPVFSPENHAPDEILNSPDLYDLLPIDRPFHQCDPKINAGVTGLDLKCDALLLSRYQFPVLKACEDEGIRRAIRWHDQGALIWAVQSLGVERRTLESTKWNLCARHIDVQRRHYASDFDVLWQQLIDDYPKTCIVHWNGFPLGQKLADRIDDTDQLLRSIAGRQPGRRRKIAVSRHTSSLVSFIGVKTGPELVRQFIEHYKQSGIDRFLLILHDAPGDRRAEDIRSVLLELGITPVKCVPEYSAPIKNAESRSVVQQYCKDLDWVVYADLDELQVYPRGLPRLLGECESLGYDFITGNFVDRITENGQLAPIRKGVSLWKQFPYGGEITRQITGGWTRKVCVARAVEIIGEGGTHTIEYGAGSSRNYIRTHIDPRRYPVDLEIHHFKWDATLVQRMKEKFEVQHGDRESVDSPSFIGEYHELWERLSNDNRIEVADLRYLGTPTMSIEDAGTGIANE